MRNGLSATHHVLTARRSAGEYMVERPSQDPLELLPTLTPDFMSAQFGFWLCKNGWGNQWVASSGTPASDNTILCPEPPLHRLEGVFSPYTGDLQGQTIRIEVSYIPRPDRLCEAELRFLGTDSQREQHALMRDHFEQEIISTMEKISTLVRDCAMPRLERYISELVLHPDPTVTGLFSCDTLNVPMTKDAFAMVLPLGGLCNVFLPITHLIDPVTLRQDMGLRKYLQDLDTRLEEHEPNIEIYPTHAALSSASPQTAQRTPRL